MGHKMKSESEQFVQLFETDLKYLRLSIYLESKYFGANRSTSAPIIRINLV